MQTRFLSVLLVPAVLVACADVRDPGDRGCLPCDNKNPLIFDSTSGKMVVTPSNICAKPASVITVTLKKGDPNKFMQTVADPGNPDNPGPSNWLNRTERGGQIAIRVPDTSYFTQLPACTDLDWGCTFNYNVEEIGGVDLDPRVTVKKMEKC